MGMSLHPLGHVPSSTWACHFIHMGMCLHPHGHVTSSPWRCSFIPKGMYLSHERGMISPRTWDNWPTNVGQAPPLGDNGASPWRCRGFTKERNSADIQRLSCCLFANVHYLSNNTPTALVTAGSTIPHINSIYSSPQANRGYESIGNDQRYNVWDDWSE